MDAKNPAMVFLTHFQNRKDLSEKTLIEMYTRYLLIEADTYKFPVDIFKVFKHFDFHPKAVTLDKQRGLITSDLKIFYNAFDKRQIQLFSQAHELIELLFLALKEIDLPWLTDRQLQTFIDNKESHCEYGAAQLLMPMEFFSTFINEVDFSLRIACGISKVTNLSLTATIRRMLETDIRKASLVVWKYDYKPSETIPSKTGQLPLWGSITSMDPPKKIRVDYSYSAPRVTEYIRPHKSVSEDTLIAKVFDSPNGTILAGYDYLEITDNSEYYFTESMSVTIGGSAKIMSIVYFDDTASTPF